MKMLTELDKRKIRESFAAASISYDGYAALQRRVALTLLEKLPLDAPAGPLLDVGCGTGFMTQQLHQRFEGENLLAMDIAMPMTQLARIKTPSARYFCADAEAMPLLENSVGMIVSNLALQWCQSLPDVFSDFHRVLRSNGQLAFATFGPETLQELKAAWAVVDDYSHVNSFYSLEQIESFLQAAGFGAIEIESRVYRNRYASVMALMQELKGIGAHNVTAGRNKSLTTRKQLQQMMAAYPKHDGGDIAASYEIIYVKAVKQ